MSAVWACPQSAVQPEKWTWRCSTSSGSSTFSFSHRAYRDVYALRLAETYLLRAEAYLGAGNIAQAAEDINVVRRRAEAPPVSSAEVDIDYILDERARELHLEENRLLTLIGYYSY